MSAMLLARPGVGRAQEAEFRHPMPAASSAAALTTVIVGLGGLGVVGLTKLYAEACQRRYPRVATTETRGIAQRRAPVRSVIRAGTHVRSAACAARPDLVVALECGEILRVLPQLGPGTRCLLSDLCLPASGAAESVPAVGTDFASLRRLLEQRGIGVIPLRVSEWLAARRVSEALVSTIAFGALAASAGLAVEGCEALLVRRLEGRAREDALAAFRHGLTQARTQAGVPGAGKNLLQASKTIVAPWMSGAATA